MSIRKRAKLKKHFITQQKTLKIFIVWFLFIRIMRLASGKDPNEQIGKKVKLVENRAD